MSAPAQPAAFTQIQLPAGTWYPKLEHLGLPRPLPHAIHQAFALIYSLRDALQSVVSFLNKQSATSAASGGMSVYTQVAEANLNYMPMTIAAGVTNDISGAILYFNRVGPFLVTGAFSVLVQGAGDANQVMECFLYQEGVQVNHHLTVQGPVGLQAGDVHQWLLNSPSVMNNIKLSVYKPPAASGTSVVVDAVLSAVYLGTGG